MLIASENQPSKAPPTAQMGLCTTEQRAEARVTRHKGLRRAVNGLIRERGSLLDAIARHSADDFHVAVLGARLASVEVRGCRFPSAHGLATLPNLPRLEKASFRGCAGGVDLEPLAARCPNLLALLLVAESGHDRLCLAGLARFPKLRELTVRGTLPYAAPLFHTPTLARLETLTVRGLSYTAFADAAAENTCFPTLVEFNGASADDARAYESSKVQDHNRKYRDAYAASRGDGLAPAAAMRKAAEAVGDLVAPRCGPKLRADKAAPPRKFL